MPRDAGDTQGPSKAGGRLLTMWRAGSLAPAAGCPSSSFGEGAAAVAARRGPLRGWRRPGGPVAPQVKAVRAGVMGAKTGSLTRL